MDAFSQNAGMPGTLPDEPGPSSYNVKHPGDTIGGGRFSTANALSDIDWTIMRSKTIPGPGQYPMPPLELSRGGRFSTAKPKGELDWVVYRSKSIPGPSQYGAPKLLTSGADAGVPFGPDEGPDAFTRARPITAPQKLKMDADARLPGPGSYRMRGSVGSQVESTKHSPATVSFGSGTRVQRRKVYMGHGVTTVEATLGEGPGYAYCHLYLPEALRPYSPASFIGREKDKQTGQVAMGHVDRRIEDVQKRREKIERRRRDETERARLEEAQRRESGEQRSSASAASPPLITTNHPGQLPRRAQTPTPSRRRASRSRHHSEDA